MLEAFLYCIVTALCCFGIYRFAFVRKERNWERISLLALSLSLSLVLILRWIAEFREDSWEWVFTGIQTVFDVLEGNSSEFRTALSPLPAVPEILSCAVPALTVLTAARLLWHYLPHHVPMGKREWYLFSELDANSVRMAKNLAREDNLCIFLRTRRNSADADLLKELADIRFFLYPRDEARFLFWPWRRRHILRFFFLSENTDENFERMQEFLEAVERKNLFEPVGEVKDDIFQQELYLLSETESAPMLIDHLRNCLQNNDCFRNTELRLLDRYRAVSYGLLREMPLHKYTRDGKLNILVLGFGKIGREFFRAACSLGILHGCKTEFTLCDQQIGQKLNALLCQCPELGCSVSFHGKELDAETDQLDALIHDRQFHYILVALGDDERNIRIASRLKRHYRRLHWNHEVRRKAGYADEPDIQPQICVNIEDSIKRDYTQRLWDEASKRENAKSWDKALHVFGGLDQVFTQDVLMPRDLWNAARYLHRELNSLDPSDPLNWGEYERRSSIACAVRAEYLCDTVCKDEKRKEYKAKLADFDFSKLADTEHLRWMAYVRSEGLRHADTDLVDVYYDSNHGKHVDILGKLTPCLTENPEKLDQVWEHLTTGNYAEDYKDKHPFRQRDECLVELTGAIARLANPNK